MLQAFMEKHTLTQMENNYFFVEWQVYIYLKASRKKKVFSNFRD